MAWQINFVGMPAQCIAALNGINTSGTQVETDQLNTARTAITAEIVRLQSNPLLQVIASGAFRTDYPKWSEVSYQVQPAIAKVGNEIVLPPN